MAKKEKKSAVPEQYKDIDFNKELANAGLTGVNASMTPKSSEDIAVQADKDMLATKPKNSIFKGQEDNAAAADYAFADIDTRTNVETGTQAGKDLVAANRLDMANHDPESTITKATIEEDPSPVGMDKAPEQKPEITGNKEQDKSTAVDKTEQKKKFQLKSIMQAFYDGEIDEETRDYLLVDTFAKAARNISKDLANVSAAYTGGSINNEPNEESMWSQRNKEVAASGIESEKAVVEGSREWREAQMDALNRKALNNEVLNAEDRRNMAKLVQSYLYDENGKLKYDPNDATFKSLMTEYNQLMNGGAIGGSMMKNFLDKLITTIGI